MDSISGRTKSSSDYRTVLDKAMLLSGVCGDADFLIDLIGIFRAACPTLLCEIRDGLATRDLNAVASAAHLLRVWSLDLAANRVSQTALKLEEMALLGEHEGLGDVCQSLGHEVERLKQKLSEVVREVSKTSQVH
jgi:hypothetical protein